MQVKPENGDKDLEDHFCENTAKHVKKQGDLKHYTIDNILRREKLKGHKGLLKVINQFWDATDMLKDENGNIGKKQYVELNMKLHHALMPDVDQDEASKEAQADWVKDCNRARVQESAANAASPSVSLTPPAPPLALPLPASAT